MNHQSRRLIDRIRSELVEVKSVMNTGASVTSSVMFTRSSLTLPNVSSGNRFAERLPFRCPGFEARTIFNSHGFILPNLALKCTPAGILRVRSG